jgi:hypothetical protein
VNLDVLVSRGEAMHQELGREHYLTGAGLKGEPAFQVIYDRYAELQGDEALAAARASGDRALLEWVVDIRVGRLVAALEERQLVWEQRASLRVDGRTIPYLRAPIELANAPDRAFRAALDVARVRAGEEGLESLRRERFTLEHDAVAALGLGDYVEAVSALSGIALDALGRAAGDFLEATEALYVDSLARLARRRLGVEVGELLRSDSAWAFRADCFDSAFPPDRLVPTAVAQMRELGLDATQGGRVRFDTVERDGKQPRAFCVPVRVPEEVYLVLRPRGGHSDFRTFWHELGHAMHFASTSPDLPFAARWLGDNSVTEGIAMLWDHVTLAPGWLRRYGGLDRAAARDLAFQLGVSELYLLRRYAAKLRYELELHRSAFTGVGPAYAAHLTEATRFRYPEGDALLDVDPGFYAARYLRAWQLEAALAAVLVGQFDEDWYRNPRAGAALHELMCRGQADAADRVALRFTGAELRFEPVAARLEAALA